jgi:hypothetical protein
VIRVYDDAGIVTKADEQAGEGKEQLFSLDKFIA